jgi:hypothetical protein
MDHNLQSEGVGWPNVHFKFSPILLCIIILAGLPCRHAAAQEPAGAAQTGPSVAPEQSPAPEQSVASSGQSPAPSVQSATPSDPPSVAPAGQPPNSGAPTGSNVTPGSTATPNGTSKDRLFFALPNFLTIENASEVTPMTPAQKFHATARGAFDPIQFLWYGTLAGISQWENSEPGFGQGAKGYAKRYGAAFGDGVIENFMTTAILPSLFHEDPRYFQMGKGGFFHRAGYAMSRILITRTDSGQKQFNFSEVLGSALASGISTYTYHPRGDRTVANTASVWGTQVGYDTLTFVVKEFWPDVRRKLLKSHTAQGH